MNREVQANLSFPPLCAKPSQADPQPRSKYSVRIRISIEFVGQWTLQCLQNTAEAAVKDFPGFWAAGMPRVQLLLLLERVLARVLQVQILVGMQGTGP